MNQTLRTMGLVLLAFSGAAQASEFVPGEIIVKFKEGQRRTREQMNSFYDSVGVERVQRLTGIGAGVERLKISSNVKMQDAIFSALRDPAVEYAQPNYILKVQPIQQMGKPTGGKKDETLGGWPGDGGPNPNPTKDPVLKDAPAEVNPPQPDSLLADLYGMQNIGAIEAWKTFKGDRKMVVAVIDTGVDYNHEDIGGNVWRRKNADGTTTVGYDFVHDDALPFDDHSHGTHCSGTIGGVGGNGKGVVGVSPYVSIMGIKFLSAQGSGTTANAIKSIDFAVANGAKVISASWGGPSESESDNKALYDSIDRAGKADVLFIAAAGNDSNNNDTKGRRTSYPAAFTIDNLIAVAAVDKGDSLASFSNYGANSVHLAAPGVKILSSVTGGGYKAYDGTSMATPHVAGAAALVWAKHPTWTYKQVRDALLSTVDPVAGLKGKVSTGGRLNVLKAMNL